MQVSKAKLRAIIERGQKRRVLLRGKGGERTARIHMKDVARIRGTMTMMRIWLLGTLPNETCNAMRAMERTGIIKTSGVVLC
jgi:hypothetical protein